MDKFTNSPAEKKSKIMRGGDQNIPRMEQMAELIDDFKKLDDQFSAFRKNIEEFKTDTKASIKTQDGWLLAGFIALLFIVAGLLVAVGAMAGDYYAMKRASNQVIIDKLDSIIQKK